MGKLKRLLVICTGNSCRSVMAKGLFKKILEGRDIQVMSAGVSAVPGFRPTPETIEVMAKRGIDVSGHLTQRMTKDMVHGSDLILVMEKWHKEQVLKMVPSAKSRVFLLREYANQSKVIGSGEIPDPIAKPLEIYELCLKTISDCVERAAERL